MAKGKRGKKALSRTETVGIRLEPKQRYLAEIAARIEGRSLSSFIVWATGECVSKVKIGPGDATLSEMANYLWDPDESDRFGRLALRYPHLLKPEDEVLWKLIRENRFFWNVANEEGGIVRIIHDEAHLIWKRLREEWPKLLAVARGEANEDILPRPELLPVLGKPKTSPKPKS